MKIRAPAALLAILGEVLRRAAAAAASSSSAAVNVAAAGAAASAAEEADAVGAAPAMTAPDGDGAAAAWVRRVARIVEFVYARRNATQLRRAFEVSPMPSADAPRRARTAPPRSSVSNAAASVYLLD